MSSERSGALAVHCNVLKALILRDMRTRFGGSRTSYIMVVGWPFCHLAILAGIYASLGRGAAVGDSQLLFIASGVFPYITIMYFSRNVMMAVPINASLLYFPIVFPIDIMLARCVVETISSFIVFILMIFGLYAVGVDLAPASYQAVLEAYLAVILMSTGLGLVNAVIAMVYPPYIVAYTLVIIAMYLASGILFVAEFIPEPYRYYALFNPMLQCVEWFRVGIYDGYGLDTLDRTYTIAFGATTVLAGLVMERWLRGRNA